MVLEKSNVTYFLLYCTISIFMDFFSFSLLFFCYFMERRVVFYMLFNSFVLILFYSSFFLVIDDVIYYEDMGLLSFRRNEKPMNLHNIILRSLRYLYKSFFCFFLFLSSFRRYFYKFIFIFLYIWICFLL